MSKWKKTVLFRSESKKLFLSSTFEDLWLLGLLSGFSHCCTQPFPRRAGRAHQACTCRVSESSQGLTLPVSCFVLFRGGIAVYSATILSPVCVSHILKNRKTRELVVSPYSSCFFRPTDMAPCGVALRQWHRTEAAGKAHWPPAFRVEVSQSSGAAGCAIERYCVWGGVGFFFFFFKTINKQIQHKLALCCWFLFSISWGLFAF